MESAELKEINKGMNTSVDIREINEKIKQESAFVEMIVMEMNKVIVGQKHLVDSLMIGLLSDGHLLLEGVPGLAKTLAISTLASTIDAGFSRIQFTPDLLPADLIGTLIYSQKKEEFQVKKGPVFNNFILADEINRAPAKVQSALLESMQERQVTIGTESFSLPKPFLVLATQNPIEQEGTYPLPEAQADRFLLKIKATYPNIQEEEKIVQLYTESRRDPNLKPMLNKNHMLHLQEATRQVPIAKDISDYALKLVTATRNIPEVIQFGASPRASIGIILASKARALIRGRNHVSLEDIKAMAYPVLRHRIILNFEAERKGLTTDDAITELLKRIK